MSADQVLIAAQANTFGQHLWLVGAKFAQNIGANCHLVNVVRRDDALYPGIDLPPVLGSNEDWQEALLSANHKFFRVCQPDRELLQHTQLHVEQGAPAVEIAAKATDIGARLVVMGLHQQAGIKRLMGSTTQSVLKHARCDVLAVHPDSEVLSYRRALVAVDRTENLHHVITRAAEYLPQTERIVVSVVVPMLSVFTPSQNHGSDSLLQMNQSLVDAAQDELLERFPQYFQSRAEIDIRVGHPEDQILSAAEEYKPDLLVVGSHDRTQLDHLLLGSTSRAVLNKASCDVLVCAGPFRR